MKELHFESFNLLIPEDWVVEDNESIMSIYNSIDGKGSLQLSLYIAPSVPKLDLAETLKKFISERFKTNKNSLIFIEEKENLIAVKLYDFNRFWKFYLFSKNADILFITYNCDKGEEMIEHDIINNIILSVN